MAAPAEFKPSAAGREADARVGRASEGCYRLHFVKCMRRERAPSNDVWMAPWVRFTETRGRAGAVGTPFSDWEQGLR